MQEVGAEGLLPASGKGLLGKERDGEGPKNVSRLRFLESGKSSDEAACRPPHLGAGIERPLTLGTQQQSLFTKLSSLLLL